MCAPLRSKSDLGRERAGAHHEGPLYQLRALPGGLSAEREDICKRHGSGKGLFKTGHEDHYLHCALLSGSPWVRYAGTGGRRPETSGFLRGAGDGGGRCSGHRRVRKAAWGEADGEYHHHMLPKRQWPDWEILPLSGSLHGSGGIPHGGSWTLD